MGQEYRRVHHVSNNNFMWQRGHHTTLQPQHQEARQQCPIRDRGPGLMVIAFKNQVGVKTVLVRNRGVEAFGSLVNPVFDLPVGTGSQSGYREVSSIDIVEQVTGPRQLLDSL